MSRDPIGKSPVSTDDIDDAWASAESPESSERSKPAPELQRPTSRPPAVRVSTRSLVDPGAGAARGRTLLGIAPTLEASSDLARTPSVPSPPSPTASADDGDSKFEAAARLLEQKRASHAPKPRTPETTATRAPARDARSSPPPTRRSRRPLPFALGAAVFAVMFVAGAMRAMREAPSAARANATRPSSIIEDARDRNPSPAGQTEPPATGAAEPVASAAPIRTDATTRVLVRSAASGAKFYRYGKQVGVNSVIVELSPGETRAFEVNLPGHLSRKVVVDGSRSEVVVILSRLREAPVPSHADPPSSPTLEAASAPAEMSSTP